MIIRVLFCFFIILNTFAYGSIDDKDNIGSWPSNIIYTNSKDMDFLLVEKENQKLYVFESTANGFKNVMEFKCSTGKKPGDKMISGDEKTPEGFYVINGHYSDRYLSAVYGSRAFTLDYPNYIDKIKGKTGYNIWIHGTNKPVLKNRDTNGCIALANSDIEKLKTKIKIGKTPVIIVKKIKFTTKDKVTSGIGRDINFFFKGWLNALERGSYHDYLDLYSDSYLPLISWWSAWDKKRKSFNGKFLVKADDLAVFSEKNKSFYTIWFGLEVTSGSFVEKVADVKLFVRKKNVKFEIFGAEQVDKLSDLPQALSRLDVKVNRDSFFIDFVHKWSKAWASGNFKVYSECYSDKFKSNGMTKSGWIKHKKRLNKIYKYIKVSIDNIFVSIKGNRATLKFKQHYESDRFNVSGGKTLLLKREKGRWQIIKEVWRK